MEAVRTARRLARIVHLTDTHVLDAASPARFEWIELLAEDPAWWPLLHMHRPYETLTAHVLAAHVEMIAATDDVDLVLVTGDCVDNAQQNELDVYLACLAGGTVQLSAFGSPQDAAAASSWPYWCPDSKVSDRWKASGYPTNDDFLQVVSQPFRSSGVGAPFTSLPGNHDVMVQGTSLWNDALTARLQSGTKSLEVPAGFSPPDPLTLFVDEPDAFLGAGARQSATDARRVPLDRGSWVRSHLDAGAVGFSSSDATKPSLDTVIDLDDVRVIMLDTNHPDGDYQGSIGRAQLAWLDERLAETDAEPGRVAVVASHHGARSLINERGGRDDRALADAFLATAGRHPSLGAWLVGHRHVNRVAAHPRGDAAVFWEITTSSTIDLPSEHRVIDIGRTADGRIEVSAHLRSPQRTPGSLIALHADLGLRFDGAEAVVRRAGRAGDRDVTLYDRS